MALSKFRTYFNRRKEPLEMFYNDVKTQLASITAGIPENDSITAAKLKADCVETAKIKDANVTAGKLATDSVETAKIKNDAVTSDKIALSLSDEQTGTGEAQDVAHGLGVSPSTVLIIPTKVGTDGAEFSFTKGSVNVVVTATTGAKFKVLAIA